jgi:2-amino-4-hydroxy-6-hydroxymethyldihydropteridine diphosphokinase
VVQVYISIGSNIDAETNIEEAKKNLNQKFDCIFSSKHYSKAEGFEGKNFINLVAGFKTDLCPQSINEVLKNIERSMGRGTSQKGMNDRVIDLDLLLFGDLITESSDFVLPSSDIEEYLFVLEPLVELAGESLHPVREVSFSEILKERFI